MSAEGTDSVALFKRKEIGETFKGFKKVKIEEAYKQFMMEFLEEKRLTHFYFFVQSSST